MCIYFKNIDEENWREAVSLKISKEQETYLPHPNVASIAESKFHLDWITLAIYKDETMIGFAMYGPDEEKEKEVWLIRYMMDERYQGKGYGKEALEKLLEEIRLNTKCSIINLSFHPQSKIAKNLYTSLGFKQFMTGFEADDEIFYKLEVK